MGLRSLRSFARGPSPSILEDESFRELRGLEIPRFALRRDDGGIDHGVRDNEIRMVSAEEAAERTDRLRGVVDEQALDPAAQPGLVLNGFGEGLALIAGDVALISGSQEVIDACAGELRRDVAAGEEGDVIPHRLQVLGDADAGIEVALFGNDGEENALHLQVTW
jgi:hypothetical protein